jgi:hypothetical protein
MGFEALRYARHSVQQTGRIDETAAFFGVFMAGARTMLETAVTVEYE